MKIALAQMAPVLLDRARTVEKVVSHLRRAASEGAELVAFGETLVPGYPVWIERTDGARFESSLQKDIYARYVDQAVEVGAGHLDAVIEAARELGVYVVLGTAERDPRRGRSIFASALSIGPKGEILSSHRKLMPTYEERLAWSIGDAHGLEVHPHGGFRVGALNCWENWMPLARAALYERGETLHVALWPGSPRNTEPVTRFLAREGRSFVLSVSSVLRGRDVPHDFPHRSAFIRDEDEVLLAGGSCVAGPDGEWILKPLGEGEERLLYAVLDPTEVDRERQNFDPAGHYSRPELLALDVLRTRP
ncbi:MAG: carbon-nitrogen hydrolase family protein [Myxococcota bacterium]